LKTKEKNTSKAHQMLQYKTKQNKPICKGNVCKQVGRRNIQHLSLGNLQETTLLGSAVEATITSYNSIQASKQAEKPIVKFSYF